MGKCKGGHEPTELLKNVPTSITFRNNNAIQFSGRGSSMGKQFTVKSAVAADRVEELCIHP